jgi:hypothetical protein
MSCNLLRRTSPLMALNGQSSRTHVCPLLDQSGQRWILARDGLSACDPDIEADCLTYINCRPVAKP